MIFYCPNCNQKFRLGEDMFGKTVNCTACSESMHLPNDPNPKAKEEPQVAAVTQAPRVTSLPKTAKKSKVLPVTTLAALIVGGGSYMYWSGLPKEKKVTENEVIAPLETAVESIKPQPKVAPTPKISEKKYDLLLSKGTEGIAQDLIGISSNNPSVETLTAQSDQYSRLLQFEILRLAKKDIDTYLSEGRNREFVRVFLNSDKWMEEFLTIGPIEKPGEAMLTLCAIWKNSPDSLTNPLYRRIATAVAVEFSSSWLRLTPQQGVERYNYYKDSYVEKKLHHNFDKLKPWAMRFVVNCAYSTDSLKWIRDYSEFRRNDYHGAAWMVRYTGLSLFGDTVQSAMFYMPWQGRMPQTQISMVAGGVCGSLSTAGTAAAEAHGVPATTMGEPGHCAYTTFSNEETWIAGNSVYGNNRTPHRNFWRGCYSDLILIQKAYSDPKAILKGNQLTWLANVAEENDSKESELQLLEKAVEATPLNITLWQHLIKYHLANKDFEYSDWQLLTKRVCKSLEEFPEMAWHVVELYNNKSINSSLTPKQVEGIYLTYISSLNTKDPKRFQYFNFQSCLHAQLRKTKKENKLKTLQNTLMRLNNSPTLFSSALAWATTQYKSPEQSKELLSMLTNLKDFSGDSAQLLYRECIVNAVKSNDKRTFNAFNNQIKGQLTFSNSEDKPFPGKLLSSGGLLRLSSGSQYDNPLYHPFLLQEVGGGFHTGREKDPYAFVELGKQGRISGIIIKNISGPNARRIKHLVVSTSLDGESWNEVYNKKETLPEWRIDLRATKTTAKYVKVTSLGDKPDYFHLSNILVYGKKSQ